MKILSSTLLATALLLTIGAVATQSAQAAPLPGSDPDSIVMCEYSAHGQLFDQQIKLYTGCPAANIPLMKEFLAQNPVSYAATYQPRAAAQTHIEHDHLCLDPIFSRTVSDF